jgi:type II secretory pathway pseudopilin PulG
MTTAPTVAASPLARRAGITLMEVLISIGILSIGLASVVALIPAGGSQAKKAIIEDRRGAMGAAAIADVVNYGMLDPDRWSPILAAPYHVVIDPIGNGSFPTLAGLTPITVANIAPGSPVADIVFRAGDDLIYVDDKTKAEPDVEPPVPVFTSDGSRRLSEGYYTWLATLTPSGTIAPYRNYDLSIVQFYKRPPSGTGLTYTVTGTTTAAGNNSFSGVPSISLTGISIPSDDFRALFPQGGTLLFTNKATVYGWRRIQLAAPTIVNGVVTSANIALDRDTPINATDVFALEGSVGVVERAVQLEGPSPWRQ